MEGRAMPSPFPGMNPYLEQDEVLHDFHRQFTVEMAHALTAQIRPGYIVRLREHQYRHPVPAHERMEGFPEVDVERLSSVEISEASSRRHLTTIELLSSPHKSLGLNRGLYLARRQQLLAGNSNFVEIDLLRGGARMPLPGLPDCDYCVLVRRAWESSLAVWPIRLRDPLPVIPVPLRAPGTEAPLDLLGLLHRCYDSAGYGSWIYEGSPDPPLAAVDAVWADQLLKDVGP
jgi:hypothetical protein